MHMLLHSMGCTGSGTQITGFWSKIMHLKLILGNFGFYNVQFIDCFEQRSPIVYVAQSKFHIAWSNLAGILRRQSNVSPFSQLFISLFKK